MRPESGSQRPRLGRYLEPRALRLTIALLHPSDPDAFLLNFMAPLMDELRSSGEICQWAYGYGSAPGFKHPRVFWLHARFRGRRFSLLKAYRRLRALLRPGLARQNARIIYGFPDRQDVRRGSAFHGGAAGLRYYSMLRRLGSRMALEIQKLEKGQARRPSRVHLGLILVLFYLRALGVSSAEVLERLDPYLDRLSQMLPDPPEERRALLDALAELASSDLQARPVLFQAIARMSAGDWAAVESLGLPGLRGVLKRYERALRRLAKLYMGRGPAFGAEPAEKILGVLHMQLTRLRVSNRSELYAYALLREWWRGGAGGGAGPENEKMPP